MTNVLLSQLVTGDDINSRQGADRKEGIIELAASIKAHGLILPLAVRTLDPADYVEGLAQMYEIIDGHRRFAALQKLKWKEPIAVNVITGDGRAQSLAANIERLPLHPVDQYDALARLTDEGWSSDRIMKAFNLTSLQVRRVLALAKMSAKVRAAWKKGEINQEKAQVFTLTSDHKAQDAVLKAILAEKYPVQTFEVRRLLVGSQRPVTASIELVGVERVTAAGIQITEDLFAEREDNRFFVSDAEALQKLVDARLLEIAADYGEKGFNIITEYDEENFEYEEALDHPEIDQTQTVEAYLAGVPEDRRHLTWVLAFGYGGLGLDGPFKVTPLGEDGADEDEGATPSEAGHTRTPEEQAERDAQREKVRLANEESQRAAAEKREALGLEAMTAALASDVRSWRAKAFVVAYEGQGKAFMKVMLHNAHARYFSGLQLNRVYGDGVEMKEYASVTVMADQIAGAYNLCIDATQDDAAAVLAELLNDSRRLRTALWAEFLGNIDSFFNRSKKDVILEALGEMGATPLASGEKKDALVSYAVVQAKKAEWLPKLMRIGLNATQSGVSKKATPKPKADPLRDTASNTFKADNSDDAAEDVNDMDGAHDDDTAAGLDAAHQAMLDAGYDHADLQ